MIGHYDAKAVTAYLPVLGARLVAINDSPGNLGNSHESQAYCISLSRYLRGIVLGCPQDKVYHVGEMRFQPNGGPAAVRHSTSTHRLTAEMMVLRIENKADFEEMRQAFEDEYRPVGPTEEFYLDIMLAASWRMRRARKIEAGLYALRLQELEGQSLTGFSDTTRRDQLIHHDATGTVAELLRYQAKLKRDFNRSRERLLELQAEWAQSQSNLTNQSQSQNRTLKSAAPRPARDKRKQ